MTEDEMDDIKDPYEDQLSAARYRAERDAARQELDRAKRDAENMRVELCSALGIDADTGWRDAMAGMAARLMPEGMEWPRYTSGEPVEVGDYVVGHNYGARIYVEAVKFHANGFTLYDKDGFDMRYKSGERFERPAPKVLDADGVEIRVGDTVWTTRDLDKFTVTNPNNGNFLSVSCKGEDGEDYCCYPTDLTHRAPVLAADGRPLREGETVWDTKGNGPYIIDAIGGDGVVRIKGNDLDYFGSDFTHERPVADTWERLEEDAEKCPCDYFGFDGEETCFKCPESGKNCEQTMARDLVRRCRALSERERGE